MKYCTLTIFRLATIFCNFHSTVRYYLDYQILNTLFYSILIHVCLEYDDDDDDEEEEEDEDDDDFIPFKIFPLCAVYMIKSSYM